MAVPDRAELFALVAFISETERLKDTLRSGRTASGRSESVAEHAWRLTLMITVFAPYLDADLDVRRVVELALIHDLGEIYCGDTPAIHQRDDDGRAVRERDGFQRLVGHLPESQRARFLDLYDDYDQARTPEARLVKGFDKLETMLQHTQGKNPPDFDYQFNLGYGRQWTDDHPLLLALREIVDDATRARDAEQRH